MQTSCHLCQSLSLRLAGDANQLPPVGPGTVLEAALQSSVVPVIDLQQIFRQECNSAIVALRARCQRRAAPRLCPGPPPCTPGERLWTDGLNDGLMLMHASASKFQAGQFPDFAWDHIPAHQVSICGLTA